VACPASLRGAGRANTNASDVIQVAIDETAARRGHDYITLFVNIDQVLVVFSTEGNGAETVAAIADDLTAHRGNLDAVGEVCIDMKPAFIKGTAESVPKAAVTLDKLHAVKSINDAVDQVRRAEQKNQTVLLGTRYLWLRNLSNLLDRQRTALESLPTRHSRRGEPIGSSWPFRNCMMNPGRKRRQPRLYPTQRTNNDKKCSPDGPVSH
jgi:transposase